MTTAAITEDATESFSINSHADLYIDTETATVLISDDGETGIRLDLDDARHLAALLGYAIIRIENP